MILGSIESITVNIDGTDHTLQEIAQIVRKNPKTIVINMSVFPQMIPEVLKAIAKSGMNLNPQQEGTTLYIPVPKFVNPSQIFSKLLHIKIIILELLKSTEKLWPKMPKLSLSNAKQL